MLMPLLIVLALANAPSAQSPAQDVTRVAVGTPATVAEIDLGKLKGSLRRLSWSPDGTQFYIQTAEPDTRLGWKLRHYVVGLDGKPAASVKEEPAWSATYWTWKSAQSAPGVSAMTISVDQQSKRVSATATPMAGNMARGEVTAGTGISAEEVGGVTQQSQNQHVFTLKLKGEVIGEFVNAPAIPGLTFGWGKTGSGLIAFARPDGKLVLMDAAGRRQEVTVARDVVLPAFTSDGNRLAWLEKTGRSKYTLRVSEVTVKVP